jgi:hypothetical protein
VDIRRVKFGYVGLAIIGKNAACAMLKEIMLEGRTEAKVMQV